MTEISERFAKVADDFAACIAAVPADAWDRPAPCTGWVAHDVVGHLVGWLPGPGFLLGTFAVDTGPIPSVSIDPSGHRLVTGFESLPPEVDAAMRGSGHYGPRVAVPGDADEQTRLLASMGRNP
jgi:hypothetical protein